MSETADLTRGSSAPQWHGHRLAAALVRIVVSLCPLAAAAGAGWAVSRSVPTTTVTGFVLRVMLAALASVTAFLIVERGARRFLPLAALLRLNLVFPDRAPSRFAVALRSTSVRKLEQRVRDARESDGAAELAEKVVTLASALNTHDRRTRGHCERTRALADLLTEELHLSPTEVNEVRWGAFLHDIGKLSVPSEILNKPGKPTSREWEILRRHPESGARLVAPLRVFLHSGVDAVGSHHENYDGSGYPNGLRGEQLPLAARIVAVADSFEVMTAVRAYKRPMTMQAARQELARGSGTQFDPHVVRAFLNVSLGRLHWALGFAAWVAELPFLTVLPRLVAQVSTAVGGGAALPPALPGIAAASLGAMAVVGHVHVPAAGATVVATPARPAPRASTPDPTPAATTATAPVSASDPLPVAVPPVPPVATVGPLSTGPGTAHVDLGGLPIVGDDVTAGAAVSVGAGTQPVDSTTGVGIVLPPVVVPGLDVAVTAHVQVDPAAAVDDLAPAVTTAVQGAVTTAGELLGGPGSAEPST
jgi:hypothetical protein